MSRYITERKIRPTEKLEDVDPERVTMEYPYRKGDLFYFMDVNTYDQLGISAKIIGSATHFLQPTMRIDAGLYDQNPVDVLFPDRPILRWTT